ncbi:MAG: hypothetical protein H7039_24730 [Bryobacteraceae bacterium]|nr:hypothetical protein [Bryobacteraceae bacterium]
MNKALQILVTSLVLGTAVPAVAGFIDFESLEPYSTINGRVLEGVRFEYTPAVTLSLEPPDAYVIMESDPAIILDYGIWDLTDFNLTGHVLLLNGNISIADRLATLTMLFQDGPVNSLSFDFAIQNIYLRGSTLELFGASGDLISTTDLVGVYVTASRRNQGRFTYSGLLYRAQNYNCQPGTI